MALAKLILQRQASEADAGEAICHLYRWVKRQWTRKDDAPQHQHTGRRAGTEE